MGRQFSEINKKTWGYDFVETFILLYFTKLFYLNHSLTHIKLDYPTTIVPQLFELIGIAPS